MTTTEKTETISPGELHVLVSHCVDGLDNKDLALWLLDEYIRKLRDVVYKWKREDSPCDCHDYHAVTGAAEALRDVLNHLLFAPLHQLADERPLLLDADYAVNINNTVPQFVP